MTDATQAGAVRGGRDFRVVTPTSTDELLGIIRDLQGSHFRFGAGCTDLLLDLQKETEGELTVINLARLTDPFLTSIEKIEAGCRLGALVTAARIGFDRNLGQAYPVLVEAAGNLASRQIRQLATVGGNLCTASPAGDIACALMALQARPEILCADGTVRTLDMESFFTGVRRTCLKENEILRSLLIPANNPGTSLHSGFIKVGTRRSMECAVVSLGYHIQTGSDGTVTAAGVAIGSVAPTIRLAKSAGRFLVGKRYASIDAKEAETFAGLVMEYACPISDLRASAQYRNQVLFNISKSLFDQPQTKV